MYRSANTIQNIPNKGIKEKKNNTELYAPSFFFTTGVSTPVYSLHIPVKSDKDNKNFRGLLF